MTELGNRARRILHAAISEYIATGEPVGSRTLARKYGLDLSPASIRNVLSDLEEAGYLAQPHTSAGRVPTSAGFRHFVDALLQVRALSPEDQSRLLSRFGSGTAGSRESLREAGRTLSEMTGAATVVRLPGPEGERLSQLRFLPLRERELLAVIVTRSGAVQNRAVPVSEAIDPATLERIHRFLEGLIAGRTLGEVREAIQEQLARERGRVDAMRMRALELGQAAIGSEASAEVVVEGQSVLIDRPEYADVDKLRGMVRALEDHERLATLLDATMDARGVQIVIGVEAQLLAVDDVGLVAARFDRGDGTAPGTIGVIGPARMDYAKVVPLVELAARSLSRAPDEKS
ncbi:MAG: heat-inducible transcription repressor HrcA [Deltaproteobacteria bacterium]|nr:heat-inducible transcription repressor HrcA [Deltaproteobacteria bacterium]